MFQVLGFRFQNNMRSQRLKFIGALATAVVASAVVTGVVNPEPRAEAWGRLDEAVALSGQAAAISEDIAETVVGIGAATSRADFSDASERAREGSEEARRLRDSGLALRQALSETDRPRRLEDAGEALFSVASAAVDLADAAETMFAQYAQAFDQGTSARVDVDRVSALLLEVGNRHEVAIVMIQRIKR